MNDALKLLRDAVFDGAKKKQLALNDIILDRLNHELEIIEDLQAERYLLLISKFIRVCNELDLLRSCGRGTSVSSLVNYCLDITKINPLDYGLVFERFLNCKTALKPDIDIDIAAENRIDLISKFVEYYPEYFVYNVLFLAKFQNNYKKVEIDKIQYSIHPTKIIVLPYELESAVTINKDDKYYICADTLNDQLYKDAIDIVSLNYLDKLQNIVKKISKEHHPYNIPLDDREVFLFLWRGENPNIFQFDTYVKKGLLKKYKPRSIQCLSILNSFVGLSSPAILRELMLFRTNCIIRKFDNSTLNEIFEETFGILIFQETFILIMNKIASFSLSEAEYWRIRLNHSKSFLSVYNDFFEIFVNRSKDLSENDIKDLNQLFLHSLLFTTPKAHITSYSIISYWGAYYKTHFRKEFEEVFNK